MPWSERCAPHPHHIPSPVLQRILVRFAHVSLKKGKKGVYNSMTKRQRRHPGGNNWTLLTG
jgi:hypothetical protein